MTGWVTAAVIYGLGWATFLALADEGEALERRRLVRMVPLWPLWVAGALAMFLKERARR